MDENGIYYFMKSKLKEREIPVHEFQKMCNVSKATLYRIMKGIQKPTKEQEKKIITLLNFNETEKEAFFEFIKLLDMDRGQMQAFEIIRNIFFNDSVASPHDPLEFIVYDTEKTVRFYDDILDLVRTDAESDGFFCEVRINLCINSGILAPIERLMADLHGSCLSVEHRIDFYTEDVMRNALTFKAFLPLLKYSPYQLHSRELSGAYGASWMESVILIRTQKRYMVLSFSPQEYQECYISTDRKWYSFFQNRWNGMNEGYTLLVKERNINLVLDMCSDAEAESGSAIFKENPCYNLIPPQIWSSVRQRLAHENYEAFYALTGNREKGLEREKADALFDGFAEVLGLRYAHTPQTLTINLCTKRGLEALVRTGRLTDHYAFIPNFTSEEATDVLKNLIARSNDPADPCRLYIVDKDAKEDLCVLARSDGSLVVEYNIQNTGVGDMFNCFFIQKQLARLFMEFAEKYVPEHLAITKQETERWLASLMEGTKK